MISRTYSAEAFFLKKKKKTVSEIPPNNRIFPLLINLFTWGGKKNSIKKINDKPEKMFEPNSQKIPLNIVSFYKSKRQTQ